ncbi:MAG TPA: tetratricopeptide repeat protein [Candidatus Acidoferrales bacterium]|nr:tetratricopeptide repeat protein [Candidatus Acidoferrales bacterium]
MKTLLAAAVALCAMTLWQTSVSAVDRGRDRDEAQAAKTSPSLAAGRKAVEAKDFAGAIEHLTKAAHETPKDADVHNLLGYSYRNLRQFDKALEHYRIALEIEPRHRGANEYIGELYLMMDQPANAEKHLNVLSRACLFGCKEYTELKEAIEKYKAERQGSR